MAQVPLPSPLFGQGATARVPAAEPAQGGGQELGPLFGGVVDVSVDNGPKAHDASPYLTSKEAGRAVAAALAG
jgi:hypothetical protein